MRTYLYNWSYDDGAIMYFDMPSLMIGLLAGTIICLCIWVLISIWGKRK